jgi:hypothetical protein
MFHCKTCGGNLRGRDCPKCDVLTTVMNCPTCGITMHHDFSEPSHDGFSAEDLFTILGSTTRYVGDGKMYARFYCCGSYTLMKNGHLYKHEINHGWRRIN